MSKRNETEMSNLQQFHCANKVPIHRFGKECDQQILQGSEQNHCSAWGAFSTFNLIKHSKHALYKDIAL